MALNRLEAIVESDTLAIVTQHALDRGIHFNDAITEIINKAFAVPVTETVFAPSKLPLSDTAIAQIADLAASSGIAFDLCLAHVVAEGLNHFNQKQEETNALIDAEGNAHAALESQN